MFRVALHNKVCSSNLPINYHREHLWLSIKIGNYKAIVGGIYRHPGQSSSVFTDALNACIEAMSLTNTDLIVAGDINIDLFNSAWSSNESNDYADFLSHHYLVPVITLPTRVTTKTYTLIDHICIHSSNLFSVE